MSKYLLQPELYIANIYGQIYFPVEVARIIMIRTYRRSHAFVLCAVVTKCDAEIKFQKLITQFNEHLNQMLPCHQKTSRFSR